MIEFQDVNYKVNNKTILKDISFIIPNNEFVAIIGPNGAGKSTLIKILLKLITGYTGSIYIDGMNHGQWLKENNIGYLPQKEEFDVSFPASVKDIVLMGIAGVRGIGRRFTKSDHNKAMDVLRLLNIENISKNSIGSLSGGEFQRVLLARALISDTQYIVLDEPEASIDMNGVSAFFDILASIHQAGKTILTISHDLHTINKYCTFLVCLNQTLHCHNQMELVNADVIESTFGKAVKLIDKHY